MKGTELKDSLVKDCLDSERANGVMPNPRAADDFIKPILEDMDRKTAEAKPKSKIDKGPDEYERFGRFQEQVRREQEALKAVERGPNVKRPKFKIQRDLTLEEQKEMVLAARRLQILMKLPDWHRKIIHAWNEGARQMWNSESSEQNIACNKWQGFKIYEVLDKSNEIFGDWRKPPAEILTFSGSGNKSVGRKSADERLLLKLEEDSAGV